MNQLTVTEWIAACSLTIGMDIEQQENAGGGLAEGHATEYFTSVRTQNSNRGPPPTWRSCPLCIQKRGSFCAENKWVQIGKLVFP